MNQLHSTSYDTTTGTSPLIFLNEDLLQRHIEELVFRYGTDSLSYLSLEGTKQYYIGKSIDGFIAYVVIQNMAICVGNPVCMSSKSLQLVHEFKGYCGKNKLKLCFCSISEDFSGLLKNNGYVISKYGEEALLDLNSYTLAGGRTEKLRQKLRRAEKLGFRTMEYTPGIERDAALEDKIMTITQEWFRQKNGHLTFTLGDLNFDHPLDRRFFVSLDETGEVSAVLMFSPFSGQKGYYLDVMRRKPDSAPGVMEKAIIDAAMKFKAEGSQWVSLGLAPLAGIEPQSGKATLLERLFHFVFHHGNTRYNFQSLYYYKKKFNPTHWNARFVAYEKGLSAVKVAYIMAKARNVEGIFKQSLICILQMFAGYRSLIWKNNRSSTGKTPLERAEPIQE